jgi:dUTP pyrophosphatase
MKIKVKRMHPNARMPFYATEGAACFDLYAATIGDDVGEALFPGTQITVGTGLAFEIPTGYMMRISPRSGLAFKHGVEAFPGVIDSDYRGEVMVMLRCWQLGDSDRSVLIRPGDRIAQAFVCEVPRIEFEEADELTETARGGGGFGSTGA